MHIPAGGGMTLDACGHSMREGVEFFKTHLQKTPAAIVCDSWTFHPGLEDILPADSNLVLYQKELYLYPIPTNPESGLWFIFLRDKVDPATAPRHTSLQRAILDHLAGGGVWGGSGGMFFLAEDLPEFGTQLYRRRFFNALKSVGRGEI